MKLLRPILTVACVCLLLLIMTILMVAPASSQGLEIAAPGASRPANVPQEVVTPTAPIEGPFSTFQITLAELDYEESVLDSPQGAAEYTLRLPESWVLHEGSFFELDFSYAYDRIDGSETQAYPSLLGDIIIVFDGETQLVFPIKEPALEHFHLRVALPLSLLNAPARNVHSIRVALDAGFICDIPHKARLIIHPTTFFSLTYDQTPVVADLARYPSPFYQRAFFGSDQVRFVLPVQPEEMELAGAVAVAARLGDVTYRMAISGTTDLELMDRLGAGVVPHEHLIVIGKPQSNGVIPKLNELGVLPVPLRERQLSLASTGPAMVAPGGTLTYTLRLTNSGQYDLFPFLLVDTLPAYVQVVNCHPSCSQAVEGEASWSIASLGVGEALSYTLELRLSKVVTAAVLENTVTLLDAANGPINVNTLTTTVSSMSQPAPGLRSSISAADGYFFSQGERAVPENDGVVQELVSPWDQTRAVLVITGLSDEAVYKASQAMSFESHFPGMKGPFALVREVHPLLELPPEPQPTDLTFADMGYGDWILTGSSQEATYYFGLPIGWRLTKGAYIELHFTHSRLLNYDGSFLNIRFNDQPVATVALSEETSRNGELVVELPSSAVSAGESNRISVEAQMRPFNECTYANTWLLISSVSLLHLDHREQDARSLDLGFYPYPFDQRPDLADVLFVLPPQPWPEEWEEVLQLAATLGATAGGPNFAPAVALGDTWPETELSNYHIIAVGRPSRNPVLQQVNDQLPQPFLPGSDVIEQKLDEVIFRLPQATDLGYVQLIPSPWSETRAFLAVTGTTDEGRKWAAHVLTSSPWVLGGNLTLARGDEVSTVDTRRLTLGGVAMAVATAVPEMIPVAVVTATSTATPLSLELTPGISAMESTSSEETNRPAWLIPLVVMAGLAVVASFAIAFWQARRKKQS